MNATPWWHERIVGGLASYWVYQHAGQPLARRSWPQDEVWQLIAGTRTRGAEDELDLTDGPRRRSPPGPTQHPDSYRWSYARDLGESRLVVVDSRAARVLEPDRRSMLDDDEMAWFDEQLQRRRRPPVHRHLAAVPAGARASTTSRRSTRRWPRAPGAARSARSGERMRRALDLEHWAAFQEGFAAGARPWSSRSPTASAGRAPGTITFLSGDVHNSYVTEVDADAACPPAAAASCRRSARRSATRCRGRARVAQAMLAQGAGAPAASSWCAAPPRCPAPPYPWPVTEGPWFDNNLATLEVRGRGLVMRWDTGVVEGEQYDAPDLRAGRARRHQLTCVRSSLVRRVAPRLGHRVRVGSRAARGRT